MSGQTPDDHDLPKENLAPHVPRGDAMTMDGDAVLPVFDAGQEPLPFPPTDVLPTDKEGNVMPGGDEIESLTDDGDRDGLDIDQIPDEEDDPLADLSAAPVRNATL